MIESRFDIPETVAHVLRIAIEIDLIDVLDAFALGSKHQGKWDKVLDEVCEFAFCSTKENHYEIAKAADLYYMAYDSCRSE